MNKVSIAIATYNGATFLREQLDSLYNQTVQPDEIFVSDDCSNDGTVEILEEYHRTKGLKYTVNEHNLGFNKNFENALKNTTGEFIMICDQDDIWMPEKVEVLLKAIKKHDCTNGREGHQKQHKTQNVVATNVIRQQHPRVLHNTKPCTA